MIRDGQPGAEELRITAIAEAVRTFSQTTGLSDREQDVLRLAAQGLSDKETAAKLGLAYTTVKSYWSRICFKANAKTRELAISALVADLAMQASASRQHPLAKQ
jgi:DNA-binding CsgD family transcriptional regulator